MKDLREFYQTLSEQELDIFLKSMHKDDIDEDTLSRIQVQTFSRTPLPAKKPKHTVWRRVTILAICITLLLSSGFGTYLYAKEVRIYKEAVQFFETHNLPTDGLSRGEIKAVYKDITTQSFTYSKTAEVIESTLTEEELAGFDVIQDTPTAEELWNYINKDALPIQKPGKEVYLYDYSIDRNDQLSFLQSRLLCGRQEKDGVTFTKLWEIELSDIQIIKLRTVGDDVIVFGRGIDQSYQMMKYRSDGTRVWSSPWSFELLHTVLVHDDQSYTMIGSSDTQLQLIQCTASGELNLLTQVATDGFALSFAEPTETGYILYLTESGGNNKFIQLDARGTVINSFAANAKDGRYFFRQMLVYGKKVYLSGYIIPNNLTKDERLNWKTEYYTAVLFVYDLETGKPEEFYTVHNSLGLELSVNNDGNLVWQSGYVFYVENRPEMSGPFSCTGAYLIFQYTFTPEGKLVAQQNTWTRNGFFGVGPGNIFY